MKPVIELDDLCVDLGKRRILDRLSGSFSGRAIGLLGPNGAGKTTLIHTLMGFHQASSGSASLLGQPINRDTRRIRERIGYMPERDAFIAGMSGVRFLSLMGELSGLPKAAALERAHQVMFYVGLGEARYRMLETYSLGMKQVVKLAQALLHGPQLLFLDEPTNGLDLPSRQKMLELITEISREGHAHVIFSSHILRDVEACCEEVLILKSGRIAAYCNLEAERKANRNLVDMEIKGGLDAFVQGLEAAGCQVAQLNQRRIKAVLEDGLNTGDLYKLAYKHQVQIRRLQFERDTLEDLFHKTMEECDDGQ